MNNYYEEHKDEYFDYNGVRYYTGTKFTMKTEPYERVVNAVFRGASSHNKNLFVVMYEDYNFSGGRCQYSINVNADWFSDHIIEITEGNYYAELESRKRYIKDKDIPDLFFGWIIYLIIMAILVIFNDRWLGWIGASFLFFRWRHKIKEEHYYYEDK